MSDIPQLVYQVQTDQNGDPYIAEHELVAKSGSWTTTRRKDGTVVKEQGLYRWHATVMEAIEYEAAQIMLCYTMPHLFKPKKMLEERMGWLLRESYEVAITRVLQNVKSAAGELQRGCELYCRWYDTGKPQMDAGAMTYELMSFMRQALHELRDGEQE